MVFDSLMRDTIELLKSNGERTPNIRANVNGSTTVRIMNPGKLKIEIGDFIRRTLPNGAEETYRVTNPEYSQGVAGAIPPSYLVHVAKLGLAEADKAVHNIIYNVTGANARINNNSMDQSTNISHDDRDYSQRISKLRNAINESDIPEEEKSEAKDLIDEVDSQLRSGKHKASVVTTLLNALPKVTAITNAAASLINLIHGHS